MNRPFSVYLDVVRFTAACLVYLWHSNMRLLVTDVLPASNYGHSSVIVFFVLSGFVIAFVTDTKERHWIDYSASRLSRVFSVVIPTLLLTPLLDLAGRALYPAMYTDYPFGSFALRWLGSGLMFNEIWFVSITFFSNVPYWSIAFEFWYYVLFAVTMFLPAGVRWPAFAVLGLLLGPKIMLLLPVWWLGVVLYRWQGLQRLPPAVSWALVIGSTLAIVMTHRWGVYEVLSDWTRSSIGAKRFEELTFARFAIGDYLLGLLVFCHFVGVRNVAPTIAPVLLSIEKPVRLLAGYTFTLYLLHQPLFLFWTAVVKGNPATHFFWWTVTLLTAGSVAVVGHYTENKRQGLRSAVQRSLSTLSQRWRGQRFTAQPPM